MSRHLALNILPQPAEGRHGKLASDGHEVAHGASILSPPRFVNGRFRRIVGWRICHCRERNPTHPNWIFFAGNTAGRVGFVELLP
jgi:hypothetical protein